MENIKENLLKLLAEKNVKNISFKRNLAKEYLQIIALDFIYSHKDYGRLVFYGGSCLRHCYGLPRLSEDLDFVDLEKTVKIDRLADDLREYFAKSGSIEVKTAAQKFRIYLKFPVMRQLGLARGDESNLLFLKVEIFSAFDFCETFKTEIVPVFKYNRSILIKTFDLPTLMATKIRAVFMRKWEKTDKKGNVIMAAKGRDYFDLMWFLQKKITPNLGCIEGVKDADDLKNKLIEAVGKVGPKSIVLDLEPLIEDMPYLNNLSKNIKGILISQIKSVL